MILVLKSIRNPADPVLKKPRGTDEQRLLAWECLARGVHETFYSSSVGRSRRPVPKCAEQEYYVQSAY